MLEYVHTKLSVCDVSSIVLSTSFQKIVLPFHYEVGLSYYCCSFYIKQHCDDDDDEVDDNDDDKANNDDNVNDDDADTETKYEDLLLLFRVGLKV